MNNKNLSINKYNIIINTVKNDEQYTASVEMIFNIDNQIKVIELDSKELKIIKCDFYSELYENQLNLNFKSKNNKLIINSSSKFEKENNVRIKIDFEGKITDDLKGIYASKYLSDSGEEEKLISTQFEATDARKAFPCIDEPNYKAKFNLTLIIHSNLTAISNMPIEATKNLNKKETKIKFQETPIMSTYLLFFAIGKIKCKQIKTRNNILIRVWATNEQEKFSDFALETSEKLLGYFESYFGTKYPLPKLDHIAIPDFAAGAMENWGCISYRETALLVDPEKSSIQTKQLVAAIIAHEMAHMWFGDLVTMDWWNDLWLNESFASWMGDKAISNLYPEWDVWTKFLLDDTNRAFELDALDSSHPIEQEVKNPDEIGQLFDAISYSKGASLIRMLENYIGEEKFKKGIQQYIVKHQYKNTITNDLWNALSNSSNKDIKTLMEQWTTKSGFPLILVSEENDKIKISQEKFSYNPGNNDQSQWIVPIKYNSLTNNTPSIQTHLLETKEDFIQNKNITIMNTDSSGFYKTSYSNELFTKISNLLNDNIYNFSNEERLGLISDYYTLLKSSKIDPSKYLDLIKTLNKENNPYIWKYICGSLKSIDSKLYNTDLYSKYYSFASEIFNNISIDLEWNLDKTPSETDQIMIATLIDSACYFGIENLKNKSSQIFKEISFNSNDEIHPNLKRPLLFSVAYNGESNDFDKIWELYLNSNSQEEKSLYLGSLTQFKNIDKIKFLLNQVTTKNIRKHDIASVLIGVSNNNLALSTAWEYLKQNWSKILNISGDGFQLNYIVSLPSYFQSKERYEEVENYYSENPVDAASMSMNQTLEKIQNNIFWIDFNLKKFKNYL
ncbi:MAG: M1 family metallopeptidase [Dehalococcoidia bacterium]